MLFVGVVLFVWFGLMFCWVWFATCGGQLLLMLFGWLFAWLLIWLWFNLLIFWLVLLLLFALLLHWLLFWFCFVGCVFILFDYLLSTFAFIWLTCFAGLLFYFVLLLWFVDLCGVILVFCFVLELDNWCLGCLLL